MWVDVLAAACSWLPSLLGSKSSNSVTCLCNAFLISFTGRVEDLGALRKVLSKKIAFGPKVSGNVI